MVHSRNPHPRLLRIPCLHSSSAPSFSKLTTWGLICCFTGVGRRVQTPSLSLSHPILPTFQPPLSPLPQDIWSAIKFGIDGQFHQGSHVHHEASHWPFSLHILPESLMVYPLDDSVLVALTLAVSSSNPNLENVLVRNTPSSLVNSKR